MKIDRLLSIVMHLLGRDLVTASDLAKRFGVTVRTIQRDVDSINAAGIPVTAILGPNGGYKILDTFRLDRQYLTFDDLFFITTALRGIGESLETDKVERTTDKIESLISAGSRKEIEKRAERLYIDFSSLGYSARRKEFLSTIRDAAERNRCLSFDYYDARLLSTRRVVEPYTIVFKWYSWYLLAWCRLRKAFRLFRLSRIRELKPESEIFRRREVDIEKCLKDFDGEAQKGTAITLRFRPELRILAEDYFGYADLETDTEGRVVARFTLPEDYWLYGTILSYGDGVEVLEPESVRKKIAEICGRTGELYRKR